jgi:signal transduction histidine kinase
MPTRLRWQLTLSHLVAIACTLLAMTAALALVSGFWIARMFDPTEQAAREARNAAAALAVPLRQGADAAELNTRLRVLEETSLHDWGGPPWGGPPGGPNRFGPLEPELAYLVLVGPGGEVLASSEPGSNTFSPPERPDWARVAVPALAGERPTGRLVTRLEGRAPVALSAAPVPGAGGQPVAAVVVGWRTLAVPPGPVGVVRALFIFGAASVAVLGGASVFALVSAGLVAYLLSRRLVRRLERLSQATEALAGGDLTQRVDEGPSDEVGQLARRFNHMAGQLSTTVTELEAARARTEAALEAKRALVANVSHELRTPLASIRGHTESLLMQDEDPETRRAYLAVIDRETAQFSRLVDDLFTLSTTEVGALPLDLGPLDLGKVVEEVASSMRPAAHRERRVTITTAVAPDLSPALADRRRVVQILANLTRNALNHTPEGGLVALRAEMRTGWIALVVEDTGVGIPVERLPHVFERFYRGDDARDRDHGGAGLGLAIVRELVEAMGGQVGAESTEGQGSQFWVLLPAADGEVQKST